MFHCTTVSIPYCFVHCSSKCHQKLLDEGKMMVTSYQGCMTPRDESSPAEDSLILQAYSFFIQYIRLVPGNRTMDASVYSENLASFRIIIIIIGKL